MKKLPILLLSVVSIGTFYVSAVLLSAQSNVVAASPGVWMYVSPSSSTMTSGSTRNIQVRLGKDSSAKVDYAEARLHFSAAQLEIVSVSKQGSYFSWSGGPKVTYSNNSGTAVISGTGPLLPTQADVLIATINFRAKSAGSAVISLDSNSRAGDITGGSRVKDVLDGRSGATVAVSAPVSADPGTGPAPSSPTTPESSPDEQAQDQADKPTTDDSSSGVAQSDATDSPSAANDDKALAGTSEADFSEKPAWQVYLLPAAGGVLALGLAGAGVLLYVRKKHQGPQLPPLEEQAEEVAMPSTEQFATGYAQAPDLDTEEPLVNESSEDDVQPFAAQTEVSDAPSVEPSPTLESTINPEFEQPSSLTDTLPTQQTEAVMGDQDTALADTVTAPVVPNVPPPTYTPVIPPEPPSQPLAYPVDAYAQPAVQEQPMQLAVPPRPTTPMQTGQVDYANMPDMFDLGAERLRKEGLGDLIANKPPQNPTA